MKWADLKIKIKENVKKSLKEDKSIPHEKYDFRNSFQYRMMGVCVGFMFMILVMMAMNPQMLDYKFLVPQEEGGYTILNLIPIMIIGYVFIFTAENLGEWILGYGWKIVANVKNRVGLPQYVSDSLVMIVIFAFIAYKLLFPAISGGTR